LKENKILKIVSILEHVYELDDIDEVKFIGVFSNSENAQKVIHEFIEF